MDIGTLHGEHGVTVAIWAGNCMTVDIISSWGRCETLLHMETLIHKFCHQFSSLVVSEAQKQFNGSKAFSCQDTPLGLLLKLLSSVWFAQSAHCLLGLSTVFWALNPICDSFLLLWSEKKHCCRIPALGFCISLPWMPRKGETELSVGFKLHIWRFLVFHGLNYKCWMRNIAPRRLDCLIPVDTMCCSICTSVVLLLNSWLCISESSFG